MTHRPVSQLLVFVGLIAGLALMHLLWLPRLLRDRHVLEALEDPARAAKSRAMERRVAILGLTLGLIFGGLGVIAGMLAAG
jgi:hypothetical protein